MGEKAAIKLHSMASAEAAGFCYTGLHYLLAYDFCNHGRTGIGD